MSAHASTMIHKSPPFQPFHNPRLTPVFQAESTAARKKYMKIPRLFVRKANGTPASAPLRKKRLAGSAERGRRVFQRQMLPHAEPVDAERMAVKVMIFLESLLMELMGSFMRPLMLRRDRARVTVVRKRASGGTKRRMWCKKAVLQLGLFGWIKAHERLEIAGWAGPVIGEMDVRVDGSVFGLPGCKIGEANALVDTLVGKGRF